MQSSEQYFGGLTNAAKALMLAEKRGVIPKEMDFGVKEVCAVCKQHIQPPKKVLRCAACKAVIYCSKEVRGYRTSSCTCTNNFQCSRYDWNNSPAPGHPNHKELCPQNKVGISMLLS